MGSWEKTVVGSRFSGSGTDAPDLKHPVQKSLNLPTLNRRSVDENSGTPLTGSAAKGRRGSGFLLLPLSAASTRSSGCRSDAVLTEAARSDHSL